MNPHFSFSRDFKKQYNSRDKKTRDKVDARLKDLSGLYVYIHKKSIPFEKIKMVLPLSSTESLSVVMMASQAPKVIVRRIE